MTNPITESKLYIENAKLILSEKAQKEDDRYYDVKYIKMAAHTAYSGVLLVVDYLLGAKKKGPKDVGWYKQ